MTALVLAAGMALDAAFGEPAWLWNRIRHPAVMLGSLVAALTKRLNADPHRRLMGAIAVVVLIVIALIIGLVIQTLGTVAETLAVAILLAQKSLVQHVTAVANALRLSARDGRISVAMIVSRDTRDMTPAQVSRAAIESAAENLSDGVIAPAFWFLLGGAPGIVLYKAINTADSMIGYRTPEFEAFGWAAARLDDVLNLIPARLTALLVAGPTGCGDWRGIIRDAGQHKSPNAGWPEAAFSRRLGIALAGPRVYNGTLRQLSWVNETARRDIGSNDIDAAIHVLWRTWLWALVGTLAIALI